MKTDQKGIRLLTLLVILTAALVIGCKKDDTEITNPEPEPIDADSSTFSAIIVDCSTTEATATGVAVIDIQKFFKQGKIVSTTISGKVVTVKKDARENFAGTIEKITQDFLDNEATLKDKSSLSALVEDSFKSQNGFIGSTALDKNQAEKLFKGESVVAARLGKGGNNPVLANVTLLSAGLGSTARTSAGTFSISGFISSYNVGSKITGTVQDYTKLGTHFKTSGNGKSTAIMKNGVVTVSSFSSSGKKSEYSYSYPLPPSPAPIYGAPSWYWEKLAVFDNIDPFLNIPQGATSKGTVFSTFSSVSKDSYYLYNARVVGNNLEFEYNSTQTQGSVIQLKDTVDISNGFETEIEYIGEKGQYIEVRLANRKNYLPFGLIDEPSQYNIYFNVNKLLYYDNIPKLFDAKSHTIKMRLANQSAGIIVVEIFFDNKLLYRGQNTRDKDIRSYFIDGFNDPNSTRRAISLAAWNNNGGEGKITIKRWSFKAF
jgi:hypothetical protein